MIYCLILLFGECVIDKKYFVLFSCVCFFFYYSKIYKVKRPASISGSESLSKHLFKFCALFNLQKEHRSCVLSL